MNTSPRFPYRSWLGILAWSAVLVGAGAGCTQDVNSLRIEGIQKFRNRQHIESMAMLSHVLELAPDDAQANYYMGLNYRTLAARKLRENDVTSAYRELDTAIVYFTQAIKSWPNYMEAVASKNEALEARGKYGEALALAEHVAENNRGGATDHFIYLGDEYRERGDYDGAMRAYKTALATDPDSSRAYAAMGKLYQLIGDSALAEDAYRRAWELDPAEPGLPGGRRGLQADSAVYPAAHRPRDE